MIVFALLAISVLTADPGQAKLERIKKLEAASSNGIIPFTVKEYQEFVLENPRPYDVVTLFSVKTGCDDCDSVLNELAGVQYSYK